MQEIGKELAASRRELARLADKLRKAPDEETKRQILAEVERLRERIQDLMQRMAEMARGIRDEHLNQEAVENVERQQDLLSQLSDIQRKLQSGKVDDALKQLDQLGAELDQLQKGLAQRTAPALVPTRSSTGPCSTRTPGLPSHHTCGQVSLIETLIAGPLWR